MVGMGMQYDEIIYIPGRNLQILQLLKQKRKLGTNPAFNQGTFFSSHEIYIELITSEEADSV
jgi:hypothetical protein